jgi:hypothetical protein
MVLMNFSRNNIYVYVLRLEEERKIPSSLDASEYLAVKGLILPFLNLVERGRLEEEPSISVTRRMQTKCGVLDIQANLTKHLWKGSPKYRNRIYMYCGRRQHNFRNAERPDGWSNL